MAQFKFLKGNYSGLNSVAITEGQLLVTKDTRELFVDVDASTRIKIGDFTMIATLAELEALDATTVPTSRLYYVEDANIFCKSTGSAWTQINKDTGATSVEVVGEGNAVTAASYDPATRKLTLTKGETFATKSEFDALDAYVGDIPDGYEETNLVAYINKKAQETLNSASGGSTESAASVLAALNTYKAENDPKVTANTEAITAIKDGASIDSFADVEAALAGKQDSGNYAAEDHKHTKDEITDFAHTHTVSEITDFDDKVKAYDYATKAEAQAAADGKDEAIAAAKKAGDDAQKAIDEYKTSNDAALALKADKSVVDAMYTNAQIDNAVQGAKDFAQGLVDAIPAQTDYTVKITENTDDATVAKTYVFTQNGAEIGAIKLAKELVVTAGSVKEVTEAGAPYADAKVGDKYIELVIANQDEPIYVPAKDLVDIYTAKDGAAEVQVAISNTNEISATLVNGGVTEEKLADGVKTKLNKVWEEVGVAQGLVDALADGQVKTNKEAIDAINNTENGILAQAKADAQTKADAAKDAAIADAASKYETKGTAQGIVDGLKLAETYEPIGAEDRAIAAAETKAGELDAALHTAISKEIDDDVKAAIDAEVERADGAYDAKGAAATAQAAAEATAAGALATARTEITAEIDADVKALADGAVKTNADAIATINEQLQWGSF